MAKTALPPFSLTQSVLNAFDTNDRINQYLIENLPGLRGVPTLPAARDEPSPPLLLTCTTCA